jgi:ribosomal protein L11
MSIKRFFREELIKKVIATEIRLSILAGCASIEPPIGPTISQFGINATDFCNRFNILSSLYLSSSVFLIVLVKKSVNDFFINIQGAQASYLLRNCGFFTRSDLKFYLFLSDIFLISKFKFIELKDRFSFFFFSLRSFMNSTFGTALSLKCTFLID